MNPETTNITENGCNLDTKVATKGCNQVSTEIWISVKKGCNLLGISHQAIQKNIKAGKYTVRQVRKNGGMQYEILLNSLGAEAVSRYFGDKYPEASAATEESRVTTILDSSLAAEPELIGSAISKAKLVEMAKHVPTGVAKLDWYNRIARANDISYRTIQRWMRRIDISPCVDTLSRRPRADKYCTRSWDYDAVEFLMATYFGQSRITIQAAYIQVCELAEQKGWRVGSLRTAERIINTHPERVALETYRDEGTWGLKNRIAQPILRSYKDLEVNEVWCGDQHIFNYFVFDSTTGVIFRPTGFFWLDMKSRRVMGFALLGKSYNKNTVALSFVDGVIPAEGAKYYGIPKIVYTDWGKPETSNFLNGANALGIRATRDRKRIEQILKESDPENAGFYDNFGTQTKRAIIRNPHAKPIEPFFGRFERRLLDKGLPGYAGSKVGNLTDKDRDELKNLRQNGGLLSMEEFQAIVIETIVEINAAPCRGRDMMGLSPDGMFDLAFRNGYQSKTIDIRTAQLLLLPREKRTVQQDGIHYNNHTYSDNKLANLIGKEVQIAIDPRDGKAIVFYAGEWVCDAKSYNYLPFCANSDQISAAMEKQNAQVKHYKDEYKRIVGAKAGVVLSADMKRKTRVDNSARQREKLLNVEKDINDLISKNNLSTDEVWAMLARQDAN